MPTERERHIFEAGYASGRLAEREDTAHRLGWEEVDYRFLLAGYEGTAYPSAEEMRLLRKGVETGKEAVRDDLLRGQHVRAPAETLARYLRAYFGEDAVRARREEMDEEARKGRRRRRAKEAVKWLTALGVTAVREWRKP